MHFLGEAFNLVLYKPLFNALILLYKYLPGNDFGIAIIVLTLLIRFLLYPLGTQAIKSQKALSELQPKLKEIQEKNKDDKDKQTKEIMALYQKAKINPFSGCLPLLIQLPILYALYRVFWQGLKSTDLSSSLYSFTPQISSINASFLGIIDLSKSASAGTYINIILVLLVGIAQYIQGKMSVQKQKTSGKKDAASAMANVMQKQMVYFLPGFIILTLWALPSALSLYWFISAVFSIVQQYFVFKKTKAII